MRHGKWRSIAVEHALTEAYAGRQVAPTEVLQARDNPSDDLGRQGALSWFSSMWRDRSVLQLVVCSADPNDV